MLAKVRKISRSVFTPESSRGEPVAAERVDAAPDRRAGGDEAVEQDQRRHDHQDDRQALVEREVPGDADDDRGEHERSCRSAAPAARPPCPSAWRVRQRRKLSRTNIASAPMTPISSDSQ